MPKRILITCLLVSISFSLFSQSNIWYFGDYAGIRFNGTGTPTTLSNSAMWTGEGSAVATDVNGDLLFYTDGVSVWNSKHSKEFTGMKGHGSSTQTALIIPIPETNCKRFFIFTVGGVEDFSLGSGVTLVEISGDPSTTGTTVTKIEGPTRLYTTSCTEKLNGVKDGKGGYWVVNHEWQNNKYHSFHVTKTTTDISKLIATDVVTAIGISQTGILTNGQGQLKFNQSGSKMAVAVAEDKFVELYDFDLATGKPSNVQLIQNNDPNFPTNKTIFSGTANLYGLEFSNNGSYLYVAEFFTGGNASVFQFDISSGNLGTIRNSKVVLGTSSHSSRYPYGAMLMGPNGKIYIARSNRKYLAVINQPESAGTACNFVENGLTLAKDCYNGLPTTIQVDLCCSINKPYLGKDTLVCQSGPWILKDTTKNVSSYLWSDYSTKSTLSVSKSGTYWVEIAIGSCKKRDTIEVTFGNTSNFIVRPDTMLCSKSKIILDAKVVGNKYKWSTGDTTKSITVADSGNYWVEVQNGNCKQKGTVRITYNTMPKPSLGRDTALCAGKTLTINGFTLNAKSYTWSTGNKLPEQTITQSGTYILEVTDNKCNLSDTIKVVFNSYPTVNLGRDTGFCGNFSLTLDARNPALNRIWNTGETTQRITVSNTYGNIWVQVSNQGCIKSDTIFIFKLPGPSVNLGVDTIYCGSFIRTLYAKNPGMNFLWSNGTTGPMYSIDKPGKYWLKVEDTKGCIMSDTIHIADSSFTFKFGNDTAVCFGQSVTLLAKGPAYKHTWNTGETGNMITVNTTGQYRVLVKRATCEQMDSIRVTLWPEIFIDLGPDTSLCEDLKDSITLVAPSGFKSYTWQPTGQTTSTIVIETPAIYSVRVTDQNDCEATDTLEVTKYCPIFLWVPTAFSPGSEGPNGRFRVSYIGPPVQGFEMLIFNRWGELLYKSHDINASWGGDYLDKPCQLGMYLCIVRFNSIYKSGDSKRNFYKGMFYLNR